MNHVVCFRYFLILSTKKALCVPQQLIAQNGNLYLQIQPGLLNISVIFSVLLLIRSISLWHEQESDSLIAGGYKGLQILIKTLFRADKGKESDLYY